jgi:hypothetical protein
MGGTHQIFNNLECSTTLLEKHWDINTYIVLSSPPVVNEMGRVFHFVATANILMYLIHIILMLVFSHS